MGELDRRQAITAPAPPPSSVAPPPAADPEPHSDDSDSESEEIAGYFEEMVEQLTAQQKTLYDGFVGKMEEMDRKSEAAAEEWQQMVAEQRALLDFFRERDRSISAERGGIIVSYLEKVTGESFSPEKPVASRISDYRWPAVEVDRLIDLKLGMGGRIKRSAFTYPFWEEISRLMAESGFRRTATACKKKWESTKKYYKRVKNTAPIPMKKACKPWPHFDKLDRIYSGSTGSSTSGGGIGPALGTGGDQSKGKEKEGEGRI